MIFLGTADIGLTASLKKRLEDRNIPFEYIDPSDPVYFQKLYDAKYRAIVLDKVPVDCPAEMLHDVIHGVTKRVPVFLLVDKSDVLSQQYQFIGDQLTIMAPDQVARIISALSQIESIGRTSFKSTCPAVPFFNVKIPARQLTEFGGLGILTIDASELTKISIEYGAEVYSIIKDVFHAILYEMWGNKGSFRESDILCRQSFSSNIYYIFLARSRETGSLPYPGALEKVGDRLISRIQSSLWEELCAPDSKKRIPLCVKAIPLPGVGYAGVLDNPCTDPFEIIEIGIEESKKITSFQMKRLKERQLELMQTLIQSNDYLVPHYQGVFNLQNIVEQDVLDAQDSGTITPFKDHIYGFESLIRVHPTNIAKLVKNDNLGITGIKPHFLRPDILFELAKATNVSLELDQACLRHAAKYAPQLPGYLMVNILPRNLYYIEQLAPIFAGKDKILFEVSESEAINNFELMKQCVEILERMGLGIAADDFGRGFSSLERIIKIQPCVIKFDRSMIEGINKDPIRQAYVKGMVEAANIINTTVLAEGVETWAEAKVLKSMGIELVQGFLFHRPEPAEKILSALNQEESEQPLALEPVA